MTDILAQIRDDVALYNPTTAEIHAEALRYVTTHTLNRLSDSEVVKHWLDAGLPNADRDEYPFGSIPGQIRRAMEVYVLENIEFSDPNLPGPGFLVNVWGDDTGDPAMILGPFSNLATATLSALAAVSAETLEVLLQAAGDKAVGISKVNATTGEITRVGVTRTEDDDAGVIRWTEYLL